jgi:hypothetical protein
MAAIHLPLRFLRTFPSFLGLFLGDFLTSLTRISRSLRHGVSSQKWGQRESTKNLLGDEIELDALCWQPILLAKGSKVLQTALIFRLVEIINDLNIAIVNVATAEGRLDVWNTLDLAELVGGTERSGNLLQEIIDMSRTSPCADHWGRSKRRIDTVDVPKEATDTARNNHSVISGCLVAVVTENRLAVVIPQTEEVRDLLLLGLSLPGRLGNDDDLLILAISTRLNAVEVLAELKRQPEGTRVSSLEANSQQAEGASAVGGPGGVTGAEARVAKPLSGHSIVDQGRIDTSQVECPGASVAAEQLSVTAAGRAVVIVFVLEPSHVRDDTCDAGIAYAFL